MSSSIRILLQVFCKQLYKSNFKAGGILPRAIFNKKKMTKKKVIRKARRKRLPKKSKPDNHEDLNAMIETSIKTPLI
jgi:hypothetical protein